MHGVLVLALLIHQGGVILPDTGDGYLLVKATLLKSVDVDQGLTKRRAQMLVRRRRENQAELVKSKHTLVI